MSASAFQPSLTSPVAWMLKMLLFNTAEMCSTATASCLSCRSCRRRRGVRASLEAPVRPRALRGAMNVALNGDTTHLQVQGMYEI